MTPLKLGLIGAGPWGRVLIRSLGEVEGIRLARIATRRPNALESPRADCAVSADWRAMIAAGDLDGVIIASPPAHHHEMAAAAIAAGLPAFLEKPMALTVADATDLLAGVRAARGILQIDHVDLFNPAWRALREHVSELGPLCRVEARFGADGPLRGDVSALWDWAPHPVALCLDLCGELISVRLSALTQREPHRLNATFELAFTSGVVAMIETGNDFVHKERRVVVGGECGGLRYDDHAYNKLVRIEDTGERPLPVAEGAPVTRALQRFADTIRSGKVSYEDAELGHGVVRVIASLNEAANLPGQLTPSG